jgi:hypothetical protein
MSALLMGCFVPDFPYFFSFSPRMFYGHTLPGMFVFDLPVALFALWLFHAIVKRPMLMFLPRGIRRRLSTSVESFPFGPADRFSLIVLSTLIGIATHLLWDGFTHNTSWIYRHMKFLGVLLELPVVGPMAVYKMLEYVSSAFGLLVVAIWIWHWYRTTRPSKVPVAEPVEERYRQILVIVLPLAAVLGGLVRAYLANGIHLQIRPVVHFTADTIIATITYFLLGLVVCGLALGRQASGRAAI